jgi:hypothetical protein
MTRKNEKILKIDLENMSSGTESESEESNHSNMKNKKNDNDFSGVTKINVSAYINSK